MLGHDIRMCLQQVRRRLARRLDQPAVLLEVGEPQHGGARLARADARRFLEQDPALSSPRGESLRVLLYLFEREAAVRFLRSG